MRGKLRHASLPTAQSQESKQWPPHHMSQHPNQTTGHPTHTHTHTHPLHSHTTHLLTNTTHTLYPHLSLMAPQWPHTLGTLSLQRHTHTHKHHSNPLSWLSNGPTLSAHCHYKDTHTHTHTHAPMFVSKGVNLLFLIRLKGVRDCVCVLWGVCVCVCVVVEAR